MTNEDNKEKEWTPKIGGKYYYLTGGHVGTGVHKAIWEGSELDLERQNAQNCFKSKATAKFVFDSFHGKF